MAKKIGAENKSRDINMVIKKKRVLIHLRILFVFSSNLENPICFWELGKL